MKPEKPGRPGATWETTVVRIETVVPEDTDPAPAPSPNRATRRALARAQRKATR